ncbi:hypothetical protein [Calidithermus chliarophilus]|uniref:hypothetical protein n=1 Tax=Calidithermus chliarophilus TaxID=52023 RepID=UPI000401F33B|nr:hypothetical protein [Calidithermus chliarophilus]
MNENQTRTALLLAALAGLAIFGYFQLRPMLEKKAEPEGQGSFGVGYDYAGALMNAKNSPRPAEGSGFGVSKDPCRLAPELCQDQPWL